MHKPARQYGRKECRDAGMALVLILLIVAHFTANITLVPWIIGAMLLLMAWPSAYYPFARAWYPLTDILGQGVSLVLLTLIYGVFVIPLGLARRALGRDPLQLRSFRKARSSVFHTRDHTFTSSDLEQLY